MSEAPTSIDLSALAFRKFPLRYGLDSCYLTLNDSRYTAETVELRNTPTLGTYINYVELSARSHEAWLAAELERDDALNFVMVARDKFAGTVSLHNIEHGKRGELGRVMMREDGSRIYALAGEVLVMSFAFEILGLRTLYGVTMEANRNVLNSRIKIGWRLDPCYDRLQIINGVETHVLGLSIDHSHWQEIFVRVMPLAKRLFRP